MAEGQVEGCSAVPKLGWMIAIKGMTNSCHLKKKTKNQQKNLAMELSQKFDHYILPSKYPFFWNKCLI